MIRVLRRCAGVDLHDRHLVAGFVDVLVECDWDLNVNHRTQ
jgi:hypothetical protein